MSDGRMKHRMRVGYVVFGSLVGLKAIEYVIFETVPAGNWPYLTVMAVVSAWLIVYYYKHIRQIWHPEGKEDAK